MDLEILWMSQWSCEISKDCLKTPVPSIMNLDLRAVRRIETIPFMK